MQFITTAKTIHKMTSKARMLFFFSIWGVVHSLLPTFQEKKYVDNCRYMFFFKLMPCNITHKQIIDHFNFGFLAFSVYIDMGSFIYVHIYIYCV